MAKVATASSVPPSSLGIGSVPLKSRSMAKRKTPSKLRLEIVGYCLVELTAKSYHLAAMTTARV
ncbi:uncharacterized protein DS421_16g530320 [Arachis hypogaea]|nr:uncharacterized protein DS421_16g530320 [Arachis hypogaea]